MTACKVENNTGEGDFWMYVFRFEQGAFPHTAMSFLPRPCQHCDNAPCVKVCPVGARFKREDGIVLTDPDRCIGCRYCELACPYGVNYFNWGDPSDHQYMDWDDADLAEVTDGANPPYANPDLDQLQGEEQRLTAGGGHHKGVVEKCTFCVHRVDQGLEPACVETCPVEALRFGDIDDQATPLSRFLRTHDHFSLLEETGTKPSVFYVGGDPPSSEAEEIDRVEGRV